MTSGRHRFRFRSVWRLAAPPEDVFAVLENAGDYPAWWPQVREVRVLEESRGAARVRSVLPYDLWIAGRATRCDRAAGVLELEITGDLEGWARWSVRGDGAGTAAVYEQQVQLRKPAMRRLTPLARPFLRANHALMMRAGERGLRRRLGRGLDEG